MDEQVLLIRGAIASLPEDERAKVTDAYARLKEMEDAVGDSFYMALALRGAEVAAES